MRLSALLPLALAPASLAQLNVLAKAKGLKYFGTATDNPELPDAAYLAVLSNTSEWGQVTAGNGQKWQYIEPSQNTFDYTAGDEITSLAKKNGQMLRCHNLVWHSQLPSWVSSGTWTNATLIAAMKNHIVNEMTHYKGQCYAWDVLNEALNEDGTYRESVFYNVIGPEYIPIAFATAAATEPSVKLYYNDYNIESPGAKSTAAQNIVKTLKARGIKIDGLGLQAHFVVGSTPSQSAQTTNMLAMTALGVEVAITELDIRMTLPSTAALLAQQSTDYVSTVNACLAVSGCIGITVWDFDDKYSWVPSVFSGYGAACLFDENLNRKPAYYGIVKALGGTVPATTLTTVTTKAATTTKPATTTTAASGTVPKYGQCGGSGWTGGTVCVAGTTCKYQNAWYSQCL